MDADAIVVGGGVSGLQAALTLGRSCRRVIVVDDGAPRNRFAARSRNLLTRDGAPPAELLSLGRADLASYDVQFEVDRVVGATRVDGGFGVTLRSGAQRVARGLVVATGQRDRLPDLPGFDEAWGVGVFACPYCHGWEHRGRAFAVWGQDDYAAHMVRLVRAWTSEVHLLAGGPLGPAFTDPGGATVHTDPVVALEVSGSRLLGVRFADGRELEVGALLVRPRTEPGAELTRALGAEHTPDGLPKVDAMQATSVPGLFVAGDLGQHMASLALALSTGMMAGAGLNHHLTCG